MESQNSVTSSSLETVFPVSTERNLDSRLRGSRTSGFYSQAVPDGKMVLIEDVQIRGPTSANDSMDLACASAAIGTSDISLDRAINDKWRVLYAFHPSLHGGGSRSASLGPDLTGISEVDLKLLYALFEHLEIMVRYRWLRYNYDVEDDESIIHVDFKGPYVGPSLPF